MKQDKDLALAKKILEFLGLELMSSVDAGFDWPVMWYGIIEKRKTKCGQRANAIHIGYVYVYSRDGIMHATFDTSEDLLQSILFTDWFIVDQVDRDCGDLPKRLKNPFCKMTKEQAAIKLDLES